MLKLSSFDYHLPQGAIAQFPLEERDSARLLVVDRETGQLTHRLFKDIGAYFKSGDLLVLNDTKVLAARLQGRRKTGGKVEVLLLRRKEGLAFEAMLKPARLKTGEEVFFNAPGLSATITARNEITFCAGSIDEVYGAGVMPLPPYIKREAQESDRAYYQTVYAKNSGAVAAPTAGLHFTPQLLDAIRGQGTGIGYLTLHVGPGTFKPVKEEDVTRHKMDKEYFTVPPDAAGLIDKTVKDKGRIFATGTTSLRALEAYAGGQKGGETDLFIYPGYEFKITDCLITNFHLPKTTLFMLVCAFAGTGLMKRAYQEAVDAGYRFYSYGDCMLIL